MTTSLITWERLPARPAALAIYADTIVPVWQPVRVGRICRKRTYSLQIRLPNLILILSDCLNLLQASPVGQVRERLEHGSSSPVFAAPASNSSGWFSRWAKRYSPNQPAPAPIAGELKNLGRCLNGWSVSSSRIKPRKQSRGCFFDRLHSLLWAVEHLTNSAGLTGLVAHCDGHTVGEKEKACPTRDGSNMTQDGAKMS